MTQPSTWAVAVLALLSFAPAASSGPIRWSYAQPENVAIKTSGSSAGVTLPNQLSQSFEGSGEITVTRVAVWSLNPQAEADFVDDESYQFALGLKDEASGVEGSLVFAAILNGTFWREGVSLTNRFVGDTSQSIVLGDTRFDVALKGFVAPTGFGDEGAGRITADVLVSARDGAGGGGGGGDPPPAETPEPDTLLLLGIAVPVWILVRRWTA
jgi:hypothetical protein